jgi:CRISPR/Cas system-associated protein endoribonuclease Cas2
VLVITEKQYASMELIIGHVQKEIIDTNEKLVIL